MRQVPILASILTCITLTLACTDSAPNIGLLSTVDAFGETTDGPKIDAMSRGPVSDMSMVQIHAPDAAATCQNMRTEFCNGTDDDCDGEIDEDVSLGEDTCYSTGRGVCRSEGRWICREGSPTCSAMEKMPRGETCNDLDDDCNGIEDDVANLGASCTAGGNGCDETGVLRCDTRLGELVCSAVAQQPMREICNGLDDNCDDVIDNQGACGSYIESHCQLFLGWSDLDLLDSGLHLSVGGCPDMNRQGEGFVLCLGTEGQGRIRTLRLPSGWGTDHNDTMGFMFRCADDDIGTAAAAQWIQAHCQATLAFAANERIDAVSDTWGPCPGQRDGIEGNRRCASTGPNEHFNLMSLTEQLNYRVGRSDSFGISFRCESGDGPRDRAIEESISIVMGLASTWNTGIADGDASWPGCTEGRDIGWEEISCAETLGRPGYVPLGIPRGLWSNGALDWDDFRVGIALKALAAPQNP